LRALECQFLPAAKWADLPKNELVGVVTHLEPSSPKYSHPLYQRLQVRRFLRILPLVLEQRWKKVLLHPLGRVAQVNVKPSSRGAFLVAPEGDLQKLLLTVAA
jgi:hypothetical protein